MYVHGDPNKFSPLSIISPAILSLSWFGQFFDLAHILGDCLIIYNEGSGHVTFWSYQMPINISEGIKVWIFYLIEKRSSTAKGFWVRESLELSLMYINGRFIKYKVVKDCFFYC